MPETFCYLLGAGASCKGLPVSENFPEKMDQFLSETTHSGLAERKGLFG